MERRRQREIALSVLAAVVVAVVAYNLRTTTPAETAARQSAPPSSSTGSTAGTAAPSTPAQKAQQAKVTDIDLAALKAEKTAPRETVRNPFRFRPKPVPPPPPPPPSPGTGRSAASPQGAGPGPGEPPPPARITLKFFGVFEVPGKGLVANLTDGRAVYRGFVGDTIEGRYRIVQIGVESIELAYLDGRGRQTIRKTGQ